MMDAWNCESCGAIIKQKEKPSSCLFCNRKKQFTKITVEESKDEISIKYEEVIKKLEEYEKDTPKRKLKDYSCSCSK